VPVVLVEPGTATAVDALVLPLQVDSAPTQAWLPCVPTA